MSCRDGLLYRDASSLPGLREQLFSPAAHLSLEKAAGINLITSGRSQVCRSRHLVRCHASAAAVVVAAPLEAPPLSWNGPLFRTAAPPSSGYGGIAAVRAAADPFHAPLCARAIRHEGNGKRAWALPCRQVTSYTKRRVSSEAPARADEKSLGVSAAASTQRDQTKALCLSNAFASPSLSIYCALERIPSSNAQERHGFDSSARR